VLGDTRGCCYTLLSVKEIEGVWRVRQARDVIRRGANSTGSKLLRKRYYENGHPTV